MPRASLERRDDGRWPVPFLGCPEGTLERIDGDPPLRILEGSYRDGVREGTWRHVQSSPPCVRVFTRYTEKLIARYQTWLARWPQHPQAPTARRRIEELSGVD